MTGLLNRRALDRDLVQALAVARRHAEELSVVMIDVDGLKETNDRLGHAAGDELLRQMCTNVTRALRAGDNAYRTAGDEFVLILPGLAGESVASIMERVALTDGASFTWGCSSVTDDLYVVPEHARAPLLLERADRREPGPVGGGSLHGGAAGGVRVSQTDRCAILDRGDVSARAAQA